MDHHGSGVPGRRARPARRNPRHRISYTPLLSGDALPAPAIVDGEKAAPSRTSLRPSRSRLGQEEAGRQRSGIAWMWRGRPRPRTLTTRSTANPTLILVTKVQAPTRLPPPPHAHLEPTPFPR